MRAIHGLLATVLAAAYSAAVLPASGTETFARQKGYDISKTGLTPRYPSNSSCSPLTSFYASWDDVDGTRRDEPHSGVDGGRLGDPILSPAPGHVVALWQANWGWGKNKRFFLNIQSKSSSSAGNKRWYICPNSITSI